eukprot:CAMPEP_0171411378 /NCGR_PEP_ID=MMETSP0880-20121228/29936_1 /TAXON_ID=67004 /ORGANISM="Thalassiosira weissflogii, Strain CCMP1336" /LENGTH=282 /DNA_ID=CAMNT_0011928451 /DNA_START=88 /DNA_END=933 /DNA_ORIENTATION=+
MTPSSSLKRRRHRRNEKCLSFLLLLPLALFPSTTGLQMASPPARTFPRTTRPPQQLSLRQRQSSPSGHDKPRYSFSRSADGGDHEIPPGQSADPSPIAGSTPTTRQMLLFLSTTVLVWVSEPLLSLVDSAAVGTYAGPASVVQLAALGPATMLCDSSVFLTYFIGLAATNLVARSSARRDWKSQIEISSHVLGVSVALGVAVSLGLFVFGETLLRWILGPGGALVRDAATGKTVDMTERVVHIALGYTRIRTVAAVFAIAGSTAQSLLLCALDTKTVALAVA